MPRLSMYRPEKGNDFKFIDRVINEEFQVGGTDVYIHKYLGPVNPEEGNSTPTQPNNSNAIPELGIQDLLFMENRDRHYSPDVYVIRGIYTMQDLDFNLSQFGLFLNNDNIMVNFHLSSSFDALGRKIMAGDVIELPHQKDEYALDDSIVALKRFYVVTEVTRPASGYSQTWYPHLVRAKCQPLVDSQEFKEILDADSGAEDGSTLRDLLSTYKKNIEINNQIIQQAEADIEESGYKTGQYYVIPISTGTDGLASVADASIGSADVSSDSTTSFLDASAVLNTPAQNYYIGYLTGDGTPPNGIPYSFGLAFPKNAQLGDFFLRTDYLPNRLFRYDGSHWIKYEDNVRMTTSMLGDSQTTNPILVRQKLKATFVNNVNTATIAGEIVFERQALSKILKPKADN
jgi:hypothetical protein